MRALAIVAISLSSGVALADPKSAAAVEKVVRANIAAAFSSHAKLDATIVEDVAFHPLVDENTTPWWDDKCGTTYCNDDIRMWGSSTVKTMKVAPFKPTIVVDDKAGVAWFSAELKLVGTLLEGERTITAIKGTWPVRVTGVLVDDKGWKVAAEKFSLAISDSKLVAQDDWVANYGELKDKVEKEIASWFPKQIAARQSARASAVNGTAPAEVGRDKAAIARLVKAWDKLPLQLKDVDWTELAGGKVGWAHVTVFLPTKKGKKKLTVGIVAVPEAGGWRWVAMSWSPEVAAADATH